MAGHFRTRVNELHAGRFTPMRIGEPNPTAPARPAREEASRLGSVKLLTRYAGPMLPRSYESQRCSIAKTLEIVGDRWTMLVVREAFWGTRRFDDFQRNLGIARTVLTDRLGRLVAEGLLGKQRYQEHPERFEYRLTEKGIDLWPVLMALLTWGNRHAIEGPPPVVVYHRECGGEVDDRRMCTRCGAALGPHDVRGRFNDPADGQPVTREAS
jgi:DNA-binding HxlR family transcriptional regulator